MKYAAILILIVLAVPVFAANNPYGVHLLTNGSQTMDWASSLIGPGGYCKTLFADITNSTQGPNQGWVSFVQGCYDRQMIPVCRLATTIVENQWTAPVPDSLGNYASFAQAVKKVVQGLPRSNSYPLYIELLNEVNSPIEWGGQPSAWEYGHCLVDCANAIRSIGDSRIKIMNAGLAYGSSYLDQMLTQVPESLWAFDVYAVHCYSLNAPPEFNQHDGTATSGGSCIDSYRDDLNIIASHGRTGVQVMLTEAGYPLGEHTLTAYPVIDEDIRADYMARAFRDYWSKWPEVVAVTPFEFVDIYNSWGSFDWVYPDSGIGPYNRPTNAHKQYYDVWNLAKPNMTRGCISGCVKESAFKSALSGAVVTLDPGGYTTTTDSRGNYYFPNSNDLGLVSAGTYTLTAVKTGFANETIANVTVSAGANAVVNFSLPAAGTGSIAGRIIDPLTNLGIADVTVTTTPENIAVTTNAAGDFMIQGLKPSTYSIALKKTNYRAFTQSGIVVAADNTSIQNIYFAPGTDPIKSNMLSNTDMETGGGSGEGVANSWANIDNLSHPENYAIDTQVVFSGTASQRITPNGSTNSYIGQWSAYNTVAPSSRIKFQAWCKTSDPSGQGAGVKAVLSRYGGSEDWSVWGEPVLTTTSGWTLLQGYFTAPNLWGGAFGRVRLELHAADNGTTWFDRAYLCIMDRTDNPVPVPTQFTATPGQGSVVLNWINSTGSNGALITYRTDRYPTRTDGTVLADVAGTAGAASTYTHSGLQAGTRYYYSVFCHSAGPANYSDASYASAAAIDTTGPVSLSVTDDGAYTRSSNTLHATWSASDPESGIAGYEYAIGTIPTGTDVVGWTSAGTGTSVTRCDLTLANGQSYYFSVRATNGVGLSSTANSDGIKAASVINNIGEAKKLADNTFIWLEDKALTAGAGTISGMAYVQEQDRSAGIGLSVSTSAATGTLVDVAGTLSGSDSERMLINGTVSSKTTTVTIKPLAISPVLLWGYDSALSILNQGLLIKTYGKVTSAGSNYFLLSTYADKTLKVCSYGYDKPNVDDFVSVTGLVGAEGSGDSAVPVLRLRSSTDWRRF